MDPGRRGFLAAFTAVTAGTAATGCLGGNGNGNADGNGDGSDDSGDGDGNGDPTGDDTDGDGDGNGVPDPTEADYRRWLFDPETAGRDIEEHNISYREPTHIPTAARSGTVERFDAYDRFISVGGLEDGAFVFDFASASIFAGEMEGWGLIEAEPTERRGDYGIYDMEDTGTTFGVDFEEMLVVGSGYDGVTRAIVDTRLGDADPYTETNEDMGLLVDALGGGHVVEAGDGGFSESATAAGSVRTGNEDGTVGVRAAEVYPDEGSVDTEAFEQGLLDTFEDSLNDDTLDVGGVRQEGRLAVATGASEAGIYIQL